MEYSVKFFFENNRKLSNGLSNFIQFKIRDFLIKP